MSGRIHYEVAAQFSGRFAQPGAGSQAGGAPAAPPNWAIVTGLVRNEAQARKLLDMLVGLRRDGVLDGIVIASWTQEYDQFPDLLRAIEAEKIPLVECPQPRLKLSGHLFHQSRAVNLALDFVPDDALVLKVRPDIWAMTPSDLARFAARTLQAPSAPPGWPGVFHRKPLIQSAFLTAPFYLGDVIVYAAKADMRTIFNFDYTFQFNGIRLGPEQMFYGNPFRQAFPLFDLFFRIHDGLEHQNAALVRTKMGGLLQSRLYLDALAHYHLCLQSFFELGFSALDEAAREAEDRAMDLQTLPDLLLAPERATGIHITSATNVGIGRRSSTIDALLAGRFARDAVGEAYLDAVARARAGQSLLGDPEALQAAVQDYLDAMACVDRYQPNLPARLWGTRVRYHMGTDNPSVIGTDKEAVGMQQEINVLRRMVDSLNLQLTALRAARGVTPEA